MMEVERCWVLIGHRQRPFWYARLLRPTRGKPASVEFDGCWALAREEKFGDVVGFYHTHPSGPLKPSQRDRKTMRAWVGSFGKPLLCLIESDGKVVAYRFNSDRSRGTRLPACRRMPGNIVIACDGHAPHKERHKP